MTAFRKTQQAAERGRLKEAEEKGDPVGGPAVSINLDPQDLSNT
ncbi:hypothetical protein T4D_6901 [Trichinella pseudospiralis]|uniref:Uncharacterized protein n=1 Tax=Trichinella pseudospiralis TaxID=6337 RepID=A0A0V1DLN3_TRIPS|nr:hypothetical protein T4D_6901 [Trichinella pseudospiralis]